MGFLGITEQIKKLNVFKKYTELKKTVDVLKAKSDVSNILNGSFRPKQQVLAGYDYLKTQQYPKLVDMFYTISEESDVLLTIHRSLKTEAFRNGIEVFKASSLDSDDDKSNNISVDSETVSKEVVIEKMNSVNDNDQSLEEVFSELEYDLNIANNAYMLMLPVYSFNSNGEIIGKELKETIRVDPRFFGPVLNNTMTPGKDDDNNDLLCCPEHRSSTYTNRNTCPICGKQMLKVYFETMGSDKIYYFKDEVVWVKRYKPGKGLGISPLVSLWKKNAILVEQDEYVLELYKGKKPPKSLLLFNTSNTDSLQKEWNSMIQRVQEYPHISPIMGVDSQGTKGDFVKFFDFMRSLDEMQFTEFRNELRRSIGSVYGVLPLWQGDLSQGGGLNNEGMQITVTNRTIEHNQGDYNKKFLPKWMKMHGFDGWIARLKPSEEEDEMARLQREQQSLNNAEIASRLGLKVVFDKDKGQAIIQSGDVVKVQVPSFGDNDSNYSDSQTPSSENEQNDTVKSIKDESSFLVKKKTSFQGLDERLKEELTKFVKIYKRKPSQNDLFKAIKKIEQGLATSLLLDTSKFFKSVYYDVMDEIGQEFNTNLLLEESDLNVINSLSNQEVLSKAYQGLSKDITDSLNDLILKSYESPEGLNVDVLSKQMRETLNISKVRADRIARTETSKLYSAARHNSYKKLDPLGEFKYKHIGPDDNRTSVISKEIKSLTSKGVTWEEYVDIVSMVANKYNPKWVVNRQAPIPFPNTRHTFVRAV